MHRFRHTFAINFLRNGGNLLALQALLGHERMDTVKLYAKQAEVDLEFQQRTALPRQTPHTRKAIHLITILKLSL